LWNGFTTPQNKNTPFAKRRRREIKTPQHNIMAFLFRAANKANSRSANQTIDDSHTKDQLKANDRMT
jgi:hypothetical protein